MVALEGEGGGGGFFFQAEDGIRDYDVTGVQTCALPIFFGIVDVQADGAFSSSQIGKQDALIGMFRAVRPGREPSDRMTLRGFDGDDVGAINREQAGCVRCCDVSSKLNYPNAT